MTTAPTPLKSHHRVHVHLPAHVLTWLVALALLATVVFLVGHDVAQ